MSEILTESFCERCGTRYTFEPARPKTRLTRAKVLSLGLKNFVLSDETTLDEAMAAARSEADRERTTHQLDAFHKTFNFCMSCRQYSCPNCWNETEERCLSCAPQPGRETIPGAFPALATFTGMTAVVEPPNGVNGHLHDEAEAEPVGLFESEAAAVEPMAAYLAAVPEVVEVEAAPEIVEVEAVAVFEPAQIVEVEAEAVSEPAAADQAILEQVELARGQTADLMRRFRPGESLDDELAAYELERTEAEAHEAEAHPSVAEPEPEPVLAAPEPAPEPVLAAPEPEPEPIVTAPEPEPAMAAQSEPVSPAADIVEQPTWQITAPDSDPRTIGPATGPDVVEPIETPDTRWPSKPEWPTIEAAVLEPFPSRLSRPEGGIEALWAASNQQLIATPPLPGRAISTIQPCVNCGLSLSATARFCRRCGTLQGG